MEIFLLSIMVICVIATLAFVLASSLVLNKVYEMIKKQQERQDFEDEARMRARGLVDLAEHDSYPLRLR